MGAQAMNWRAMIGSAVLFALLILLFKAAELIASGPPD
jgi:hypothetical protein